MFDAAYGFCALAIAVALAFKLRGLKEAPSAQLTASCLAHAFVMVAFLSATPLLYRAIGRATGIPNLATLVVYSMITCFGGAAQALALLWTTRAADPTQTWSLAGRRVVRRVAAFGGLLALMVGLFVCALYDDALPGGPHPLDFDTTYAPHGTIALFLVVYQAGFALALLGISRACRRHAGELATRLPPRPTVRTGVRLIAAGCQVALGYVAGKLLAIGAAVYGAPGWDAVSTVVAPAFASVGALLICVGFIYPAGRAWQGRRSDYLALRPLWLVAAEADRGVLLDPVPSELSHRLAVRDLKWRLSRCTAEIRDAQLSLRIWEAPEVAETARDLAVRRGLAEEETDAVVGAAAVLGALRARRTRLNSIARQAVVRGLPLEAVTEAVADALSGGVAAPGHLARADVGDGSVDQEAQLDERERLVRISRALASPVVGEALRRTTATGKPRT